MVHSDGEERKPKRHKTLRACDRCRDKKLGCRYSLNHPGGTCDQCHEASTSCEFLAPAKIDKRRLQVMLERAVTEEDKKKLADMVAERGVYLPKSSAGRAGRSEDGGSGAGGSARKKSRISEKSGSRAVEGDDGTMGRMGTESERSSIEGQSMSVIAPNHNPPYPFTSGYSHPSPLHPHEYQGPGSAPIPPTGYYPPPPDDFGRYNHSQAGPSRLPDMQVQQDRYGPSPGETSVGGRGILPDTPAQTVLKTTGLEPRMLGATAITNLLTEVREVSDVTNHDSRFGLFRLTEEFLYSANPSEPLIDKPLVEKQLELGAIEQLTSFFAAHIAPLNPIILPSRVMDYHSLPSPLLFSIMGVAALHRSVPLSVFLPVRRRLDELLEKENVEHYSTLNNIQTLGICCMSHEMHGVTSAEGGSMAWIRTGTAIRQCQDVGLHRSSAAGWNPDLMADRYRVWLANIIADRWYACAYGQPIMINLLDCDDPLKQEDNLQSDENGLHSFQKQVYLTSCLLGRIFRTIYRPNALDRCTEEDIHSLSEHIDRHIAAIPPEYQFTGEDSSPQAGLLNLMVVCMEILFLRNFVKLNRKVPSHLKYKPSASRWCQVVKRSRGAIAWMDKHGDVILDCWYISKYAVTYAALVQYYHAISGNGNESLKSLATASQLMQRWSRGHGNPNNQNTGEPDKPLAFRAKVADIVKLLHEAAVAARQKADDLRQDQIRAVAFPPPAYPEPDEYHNTMIDPSLRATTMHSLPAISQALASYRSGAQDVDPTMHSLPPQSMALNGQHPHQHYISPNQHIDYSRISTLAAEIPLETPESFWPSGLTMDAFLDGFGNAGWNGQGQEAMPPPNSLSGGGARRPGGGGGMAPAGMGPEALYIDSQGQGMGYGGTGGAGWNGFDLSGIELGGMLG